jgi:hypothetical protein
MKNVFKKILLALAVLLVLFQFYPRAKNNVHGSEAQHIGTVHQLPDDVKALLKTSCYDCHSNNTVYPWYYNIQPLAWWLDDHIKDGKKDLNFSEFAGYRLAKQYKKLEEIEELVTENEMPLTSYTLVHRDAKLNDQQKLTISNWTKMLQAEMRAKYPADSLIRKKK